MGKIEKLLDRTIEDKGEFWRIVVVLAVVATLLVTLAGFGLKACNAELRKAVWTTDGTTSEQQAEPQDGRQADPVQGA